MNVQGRVFAGIACAALATGCGGGGGAGPSNSLGPPVPLTSSSPTPTAKPTPSPTPTPVPVNAHLDAMVVTMPDSTLAVQGPAIAAYAQHYQIHTIFLALPYQDYTTKLPKGDPATVAALKGLFAVADVYLVAGNSKWQLTPGVVPSQVPPLIAVGNAYPQFKGIVYDLEPEALPNWATDRQATIDQYMQFVKFLLVSPGGYAFRTTLLSVAPYFEYNNNSSGTASPSLLQEVQAIPQVSGLYMQDYYAPPAAQLNNAATLALGQIDKPFWWGSTTDPGDQPGTSYNGTSAQTFVADMQTLRSLVQPKNAHFNGLFVNAWTADGTSLQSVLPKP